MSARRKKLTPEQLYAQAEERELLGVTKDGRLVLWGTGRVIPVSQFQYRRDEHGKRWIDDGHFVIDWAGAEVTVHLGNFTSGKVSMLFMCQGGRSLAFTRRWIRPLLRYKVIPNPVHQREVLARLEEIGRRLVASEDTPDRQRGEHPRRHLFRPAVAPA